MLNTCLALSESIIMEEDCLEGLECLEELNALPVYNNCDKIQLLETALKTLQNTNDVLRHDITKLQKQLIDLTSLAVNNHVHILYNDVKEATYRLEKECKDLKITKKVLENNLKEIIDKINILNEENLIIMNKQEDYCKQRLQILESNLQANLQHEDKDYQRKVKELNDNIRELQNSNTKLRSELMNAKERHAYHTSISDTKNQERITLLQNKLLHTEQQLKRYEKLKSKEVTASCNQDRQINTIYETMTNIEIVKEVNYRNVNQLDNVSAHGNVSKHATVVSTEAITSKNLNLNRNGVQQTNRLIENKRVQNFYKKPSDVWVKKRSSIYTNKPSATFVETNSNVTAKKKKRKIYSESDYLNNL